MIILLLTWHDHKINYAEIYVNSSTHGCKTNTLTDSRPLAGGGGGLESPHPEFLEVKNTTINVPKNI